MNPPLKNKLQHLLTNPQANQELKHTLLAFSIQSTGTLINFGFNTLCAKTLGAEGAGLFFLALSIVSIAIVVGRMGLDAALLRSVASHYADNDWAKVKGAYLFSMQIVALASGLIATTLFLTAPFLATHLFQKHTLAEPLRWMSLSILPLAMANLQTEALKGISQLLKAMLLQSIAVPFCALGLFFFLLSWAELGGVVSAYVITTALISLISLGAWCYALRQHRQIKPVFTNQEIWAGSRSLHIISIINGALLPWMPIFLLGIWASSIEVGLFAIATRVSMLVSFMLSAIINVIAPKFASLYAQGNLVELGQTARRAARITLLFATPIVLVLILASQHIMSYFGESFAQGGQILLILGIAQFINAACGPVGNLLIMTGNQNWLRLGTIRSCAIQLIIAVILIPSWGAMGAAIALATSTVTNNLWAIFYIKKHLGISYPIQFKGQL